jgi:hypothetical protein
MWRWPVVWGEGQHPKQRTEQVHTGVQERGLGYSCILGVIRVESRNYLLEKKEAHRDVA